MWVLPCQIPYVSHFILFSDQLINLIPLQQQQIAVRYFLYLCIKMFPVLLPNKVRVFPLPWKKVILLAPSIASSVDGQVKGYISPTSCNTTYQRSHSDQGIERWRWGRGEIRERKKKNWERKTWIKHFHETETFLSCQQSIKHVQSI